MLRAALILAFCAGIALATAPPPIQNYLTADVGGDYNDYVTGIASEGLRTYISGYTFSALMSANVTTGGLLGTTIGPQHIQTSNPTSPNDPDAFIIAFDSNVVDSVQAPASYGTKSWAAHITGPDFEKAYTVATDGGRVYACGSFNSSIATITDGLGFNTQLQGYGGWDGWIAAFAASNGALLWSIVGGSQFNDECLTLAIGYGVPAQTIAYGGYRGGGPFHLAFVDTSAMAATGVQGPADGWMAVASAATGNVSNWYSDIVMNEPQSQGFDKVTALAIDRNRNVYMAGQLDDGPIGGKDIVFLCLNQTQAGATHPVSRWGGGGGPMPQLYSSGFGPVWGSPGDDGITSMVIDSSSFNNPIVYVTGWSSNGTFNASAVYSWSPSSQSMFVGSFHSETGYTNWIHVYGSAMNQWAVGNGIAVDFVSGSMYVTGWVNGPADFLGPGGNTDAMDSFLIKLSSGGVLQWVSQNKLPFATGANDWGTAVALVYTQSNLAAAGNGYQARPAVYGAGVLGGPAAFDASGNPFFASQLKGSFGKNDGFFQVIDEFDDCANTMSWWGPGQLDPCGVGVTTLGAQYCLDQPGGPFCICNLNVTSDPTQAPVVGRPFCNAAGWGCGNLIPYYMGIVDLCQCPAATGSNVVNAPNPFKKLGETTPRLTGCVGQVCDFGTVPGCLPMVLDLIAVCSASSATSAADKTNIGLFQGIYELCPTGASSTGVIIFNAARRGEPGMLATIAGAVVAIVALRRMWRS